MLVRPVLLVVLSIVSVLVLSEILARILVSEGHAMQSGSIEFDSKYAIALAPSEHNRPTVFCVGDSLMSRGVYPELLAGRLRDSGINVNVRNLAVSASWPRDVRYLLELAIEKGARPQLVLYDVSPIALKADAALIHDYSPRLRESYMGSSIVGESPDLIGQVKRMLCQHFYLLGYRQYIKEELRSAIDRACLPGKYLTRTFIGKIQAETSPNGWAPAFASVGTAGMQYALGVPPTWDGLPNVAKSNPTSSSVYAIGPIKRFCEERGIPLVLVWLPVHPLSLVKNEKNLGLSPQDCTKAFTTVATPGTRFLDLHDLDHDPRHFIDLTHLNAAGAVAATEKVAESLREPPFRELMVDRKH